MQAPLIVLTPVLHCSLPWHYLAKQLGESEGVHKARLARSFYFSRRHGSDILMMCRHADVDSLRRLHMRSNPLASTLASAQCEQQTVPKAVTYGRSWQEAASLTHTCILTEPVLSFVSATQNKILTCSA